MTLDLVLVCPGCRTRTPGGERLDVKTLERTGDVLACECGRRYPIVDGVPIVLADPAGFLRNEIAAIVERDLAPEVAALLVADGPDDAPYPRMLEHLSTYLDAHWGDRTEPRSTGFAMQALIAKLAGLPRVDAAVELGCSTGRILAELAARADRVVGIDLQFASVRRARRLLDGERLEFARRIVGRHYASAAITPGDRTVPASRRLLVCGDALDPPLIPAVYPRVVALNLLDSVSRPRQLLSVIDGLCAPGGELILASPYAWASTVMHEGERLGSADPAAVLETILTTGAGLGSRYRIEDAQDLPWSLRRDARSRVSYQTHYLRARKL